MKATANMIDLDLLRSQISLPSVLALYGINIEGNILCWWHTERTPSMTIYEDHAFCHSCRKRADIFDFIMKKEKLNLERAVEWLLKRKGIVPEQAVRREPVDYKGPMPLAAVDYWHEQLDTERRQYLYGRLLTDEILDKYRIGYRPDYGAYTIPFWGGIPGQSEVRALQYRKSPNSDSAQKYWWETGRYTPCLFNSHLINSDTVIIVFGSLDALLGAQDGLPMVTGGSVNALVNERRPENIMIREALTEVQHTFVIPDGSNIEFVPSIKLMYGLEAEIRFFPFNRPKDYTDYRAAGYSVDDFIDEVLEMPSWKNARMYAVHEVHLDAVTDILNNICRGNKIEAFKVLQQIVGEARYGSGCITQSLAMDALIGPQHFGNVFNSEEWSALIDEIGECVSYPEIVTVIGKYGDIAADRLGGF